MMVIVRHVGFVSEKEKKHKDYVLILSEKEKKNTFKAKYEDYVLIFTIVRQKSPVLCLVLDRMSVQIPTCLLLP